MPATLSFQKMLSARSPGTSQHVLDLTAGQGSTSLLEKKSISSDECISHGGQLHGFFSGLKINQSPTGDIRGREKELHACPGCAESTRGLVSWSI